MSSSQQDVRNLFTLFYFLVMATSHVQHFLRCLHQTSDTKAVQILQGSHSDLV